MEETNAIRVLKTFTGKELDDLEAFINSPSQLRKRDVRQIFIIIKQGYPDFKKESLKDEIIFKSLFPEEKFEKKKLSLAAFYLYDSVCDFLALLNANEKEPERTFALMEELLKRGIENSFTKLAKKLDGKIKSTEYLIGTYFVYRNRLEDLMIAYFSRNHDYKGFIDSSTRRTENTMALNLLRSMRSVINKYFAEISYNLKTEGELFNAVIIGTNFKKIFSSIETHPYLKLLEPIFHTYQAVSGNNLEESLLKAEDSFIRNIKLYSREEKVYIYSEMVNLYDMNIREAQDIKKKKALSRRSLNLTKVFVDEKLYKTEKDKYMQMIFFRNVVLTALDAEEFKWAENFILQHYDKLKPSYSENMKNFCLAETEFSGKNFEKSLEYLSNVSYNSFVFKRDVKMLLMNLYYELNFIEQSYYIMDNTKRYLKKTNEISEEDKLLDYNFIEYYKRLLKLKEKPDKNEAELCIKKLKEQYNKIENPDWLINKFREKIR